MKVYFYILLITLFSTSCNRGLSEKDEAMVRMAIGDQEKKVLSTDMGLMLLVGGIEHLPYSHKKYLDYIKKIRKVYDYKLDIDNQIKTKKQVWENTDQPESEILIFHKQYVAELKKMLSLQDSVLIEFRDSIRINPEEWFWLVKKFSGKQILSSQSVKLYLRELESTNQQMAMRLIGRMLERMGQCYFNYGRYQPYLFDYSDTLFLENDFQTQVMLAFRIHNFFTQKANNKVGLKILYERNYHFTPKFSNPNLTKEWQTHTIEVEAWTKYDFAPKIYKTNVRFLLRKKRE